MAGAAFEVELKGGDRVRKALLDAAGRLDRPAPMFDAIGAMLVTSTGMRFERETDPAGDPWPRSIRAELEGGKTLTDSARLRQSMTHEASDQGVGVGTNLIYAAIHQFGGTIRGKDGGMLHFSIGGADVFRRSVTLPRRAFLGLDEDDEKAIEEIASDFVLQPAGVADAG